MRAPQRGNVRVGASGVLHEDGAAASYLESIKCGVTTVNDMYRKLDALADAADEIGIRAVLSNDVADAEHNLDTLDDNKAAFQAKHGAGNGRVERLVTLVLISSARIFFRISAALLSGRLPCFSSFSMA